MEEEEEGGGGRKRRRRRREEEGGRAGEREEGEEGEGKEGERWRGEGGRMNRDKGKGGNTSLPRPSRYCTEPLVPFPGLPNTQCIGIPCHVNTVQQDVRYTAKHLLTLMFRLSKNLIMSSSAHSKERFPR